jgi:hypothetical protein
MVLRREVESGDPVSKSIWESIDSAVKDIIETSLDQQDEKDDNPSAIYLNRLGRKEL